MRGSFHMCVEVAMELERRGFLEPSTVRQLIRWRFNGRPRTVGSASAVPESYLDRTPAWGR
jgi:hypothetical protein